MRTNQLSISQSHTAYFNSIIDTLTSHLATRHFIILYAYILCQFFITSLMQLPMIKIHSITHHRP